jgi:hypothetical protein
MEVSRIKRFGMTLMKIMPCVLIRLKTARFGKKICRVHLYNIIYRRAKIRKEIVVYTTLMLQAMARHFGNLRRAILHRLKRDIWDCNIPNVAL